MLNCGYGHGHSVREVVNTVRRVTGIDFPVEEAPRRPGDSSTVVAGDRKICQLLGWQPQHDDLEFIVRTAWNWERRLQACGGPAAFDSSVAASPTPAPAER